MSHLRLVGSYDQASYPWEYAIDFDPHDPVAITNAQQRLLHAAALVDVTDYKIFVKREEAVLCMKDRNDFEKVSLALYQDSKLEGIEEIFTTFAEGTDRRRIKNVGHSVMRTVRGSEIGKDIGFKIDTEINALIVTAKNKMSYLKFCAIQDGTAELIIGEP